MKKYLAIILPLLLNAPAHAGNSIRSVRTARYISMENGNHPLTCNRKNVGVWEKFVKESAGDGYYYIRSTHNNKYLRRSGNKNHITCTHSKNLVDDRMKWRFKTYVKRNGKDLTGVGIINKSSHKGIRQEGKEWNKKMTVTSSYASKESHKRFVTGLW